MYKPNKKEAAVYKVTKRDDEMYVVVAEAVGGEWYEVGEKAFRCSTSAYAYLGRIISRTNAGSVK